MMRTTTKVAKQLNAMERVLQQYAELDAVDQASDRMFATVEAASAATPGAAPHIAPEPAPSLVVHGTHFGYVANINNVTNNYGSVSTSSQGSAITMAAQIRRSSRQTSEA